MKVGKFTLVELLVVVAIIGILASMLLPALSKAREKAHFAVCMSQRDQVAKAMNIGLDDNDDITPMIQDGDFTNPEDRNWVEHDWIGSSDPNGGELIFGVIGLYIEEYERLMRCPSLPTGSPGDQKGSNGFYDYTHLASMARIKIHMMGNEMTSMGRTFATPWTLEENPKSINGGNKEGAFANTDMLGNWHDFGKKGGYTALDGHSVVVYGHGENMTANSMDLLEYNGSGSARLNSRGSLETWPRPY